ncbi:MAG: DUF4838 domain-containing protein [Planctomycetales bacterium]|nr:DUF4838 domain-containing protein [Planctomycetales bacterium]
MRTLPTSLVLWACSATVASVAALPAHADHFLVEAGQPRAEIVIASDPPRSTRLAARELQVHVEKMTGAKLPISIGRPLADELPVKVYVGQSRFTEQLGVTAAGLEHGAFRIVAGDDWLALIGNDDNFTPKEPWPRGNSDIASGKMQQAWDEITGKHWGYPHTQLHKHYSGPNALFGTPKEQLTDADGDVHVWTFDERGSFNAVCGFLRSLGVRWYLPGELGEVIPQLPSIALPRNNAGLPNSKFLYDQVTRPDFPLRVLNFRPGVYGRDVMMWGFRLGVRQPFGRQAAHGLDRMTHNEHTLKHHPDWFALYGGQRHTQPNQRLHQLCYSNEELFREAVQFARAQFDQFDMDVVSIMPPDGYTAICQCPQCAGKQSPELGQRGMLSNYVWDFVNRVAKEVAKTHPGKKISNCAYGVYTAPPSNIEKLEPNVQVIIVGGRRPTHADREELRRLRAAWAAKTDNPLEIFENYPFTGRGFYLPAFIPRVLGESINETKQQSRGEDIWLTMNFDEQAVGFNHFLVYFTARMYWGGPQQNAGAMFDEYCRLFYGPVADEMREFFAYCEQHWREMEHDGERAGRALELFAAAKSKVDKLAADRRGDGEANDIYAQRVALIDRYLEGLRNKRVQLAQQRGPVPKLRLVSGAENRGKIVVDGKLDDGPWKNIPNASTGRLRELQTGREPIVGATVMTEWIGNNLYFGIHCDEIAGTPLNIAATKSGDQAIWYGDVVEILLNTDSHNYYQLAVNPAGALVDLDRGAAKSQWFNWSSQAEVATHVAEDHWTVEIRIPVTDDGNDPLHQVVGRRPTQSLPWHINVCRQRIRDNGTELSALSPTGAATFHVPLKFAHFHAGLSHTFPADSTVSDYVLQRQQVTDLMNQRRDNEALATLLAMAESEGATDLQKSDALELAAGVSRRLKQYEQANELADRIPIDAVAKVTRMENLLIQQRHMELLEKYGGEDLSRWPFWKAGGGAYARAKALMQQSRDAKGDLKRRLGDRIESDLRLAITHTSDTRTLGGIYALQGSNREHNLERLDLAVEAYRRNFVDKQRIGAAVEFHSVQNAARLLTQQGKHDEAVATLKRADIDSLKGFWRHSLQLSLGDALSAAGQPEAARQAYQDVANDASAPAAARERARRLLNQ